MPEDHENERPEHPSFIVVTKDFCGMGFAKMIQDAGYPVVIAYKPGDGEKEKPEEYKALSQNYIKRVPLDRIFEKRENYRESYWLFDSNHWPEYGQTLIDEEFRVWGGSKLSDKMEHDRNFGVEIAAAAGLGIPEHHEFGDLQAGMDFLQENSDRAFVFKPDDQNHGWDTFVPDADNDEAANRELITYMQAIPQQPGEFILQERKKGVEANFEVWVNKGVPFFAFADLECKKKLNDDYGCLVGGAQDICFTLPLDSKAVQETSMKLLATEELKEFTGFLDVNVIISDRENYFLEFCGRFGYPAHPTLFQTLALDSFPDLLMDMIDGRTEDFYNRFRHGFGAGISLYTDKAKKGMPIYVADTADKHFFPYDLYMKEDILLLAGLDAETGVITGHGYTVKQAAEEAIKNRDRINFPNRSARSDLDKNNYPSAPQGRYDALVAMKYV